MTRDTSMEVCLPSDPESASRARAEVRDWLGEEHPAYEPARLAVSELITNAVRHARHSVTGCAVSSGTGTATGPAGIVASNESARPTGLTAAEPLVLRLSAYGDRLRVEVTDRGLTAGNPRVRADPAFLLTESGRGLGIVHMLSDGAWGYRPNPEGPGRTVWCEIPLESKAEQDEIRRDTPPGV